MDLTLRSFFRLPIPEIAEAAQHLNEAVTAHLAGRRAIADELIRRTNTEDIWEWGNSLMREEKEFIRFRHVPDAPPDLHPSQQASKYIPMGLRRRVLQRDGYHCRFCGIPVIPGEVRAQIREAYRDALPWGDSNRTQHAAFQTMWVQYDHLLPRARGGRNEFDNLLITCAPCNYGRREYTLEEVGLIDPLTRDPVRSTWDGLERFRLIP